MERERYDEEEPLRKIAPLPLGTDAPRNTTMPVTEPGGDPWDTVAAARAELGHPGASAPGRVAGGAMARYGTGDIAGAENLATGTKGKLSGFNTNAWGSGERGTNSIKNSFGKIASRYDAKPSSLAAIFADPDFQRLFPEASIVEGGAGDKIDFGDGRPVDVLQSADPNADSAIAWDWMTEDGGGDPMAAGGGFDAGGIDLASILSGGDPMQDILARIQALQEGAIPAEEQAALASLLQGA